MAGLLFAAALLTAAITPFFSLLARRVGIVDTPEERRVHGETTPSAGGISIFVASVLVLLAALFVSKTVVQAFVALDDLVWVVAGGAFLLLVVGAVDDFRPLGPRTKLLSQVLAGLAVAATGLTIDLGAMGCGFLAEKWIAIPLTVLWIVAITNATNLIDGLDGLASGICLVAFVVISVRSLGDGGLAAAMIAAILAGSVLGFLGHNLHPAKVFLGDGGTMVLGFLIAVLPLLRAQVGVSIETMALTALALSVPLMDTAFAIVRRRMAGQPIFSADTDHIHHRLLRAGYGHRGASLLLTSASCFSAILGLFVPWRSLQQPVRFLILGFLSLAAVAAFVALLRSGRTSAANARGG